MTLPFVYDDAQLTLARWRTVEEVRQCNEFNAIAYAAIRIINIMERRCGFICVAFWPETRLSMTDLGSQSNFTIRANDKHVGPNARCKRGGARVDGLERGHAYP